MKKSLTRKLTIAVIALVFAVVSLSTSTYAWFTMSTDADVDAFTADVKAGQGIEIAVTKTNDHSNAQWYTGLVPKTVVQGVVPENLKFDAVTTADAKTFNKLKNAAAVENTDYLTFYVHIKAAEQGSIRLNGITLDSMKEAAAPGYWTADAAYQLGILEGSDEVAEVAVNDKVLYEVENAARVSIAVYNESSFGAATIYENKASDTTLENEENGIKSYVAGNQTGLNNSGNTNGAFSYYNSKSSDAEDLKADSAPTVTSTTIDTLSNPSSLKPITANGICTLEVKVWIEGWDTECINAIFAQTLSVALSFDLKK